jgi:PTH1 family peptidyl-tRNA hydrolase
MKAVVGLGNPGSRYVGTRHNVGFAVIDLLAHSLPTGRFQTRFRSQVAESTLDGLRLLLVKPETFMNLSGGSVRELLDYHELALEDLLVVCDDINLPLGKLRVRRRGTHGGHNGLRDIQEHLSTTDYARLRIGVGFPEGEETIDHVLGRFRRSEQKAIEDTLTLASQAVVFWAQRGTEACMNQYNG